VSRPFLIAIAAGFSIATLSGKPRWGKPVLNKSQHGQLVGEWCSRQKRILEAWVECAHGWHLKPRAALREGGPRTEWLASELR
jgi:hypothetical protein